MSKKDRKDLENVARWLRNIRDIDGYGNPAPTIDQIATRLVFIEGGIRLILDGGEYDQDEHDARYDAFYVALVGAS